MTSVSLCIAVSPQRFRVCTEKIQSTGSAPHFIGAAIMCVMQREHERCHGDCSTFKIVLPAKPKHLLTRSLPQANRRDPVATDRQKQRPEFEAHRTAPRHPGPIP
jgi:hypothetical protein